MLVSHKYRFIYMKTGKTAGTSIEDYFMPYCRPEGETVNGKVTEQVSNVGIVGRRGTWAEMGPMVAKQELKWWNHMPASVVKNQLGDEIWDNYFKFCCIRNPFDKVISGYEHLDKARTFKQRMIKTLPIFDRYHFRKFLTRWKITDWDQYTLDGELCLDDYIRYESLLNDLERICQHVGVPFKPDRLKRLKSHHRRENATVSRLYTKQTRFLVEEKFAFEIDRFGYKFPLE